MVCVSKEVRGNKGESRGCLRDVEQNTCETAFHSFNPRLNQFCYENALKASVTLVAPNNECPALHPASLSTRWFFLFIFFVFLCNFRPFQKLPTSVWLPWGSWQRCSPGHHQSPSAKSLTPKEPSHHILQAMQPGSDRSGNVCRFSAAGSNGSSISLLKWPAFTLKLISCMSFSWFLSEVSWQ